VRRRSASSFVALCAVLGAALSAQQTPDRSRPPEVGPPPTLRLPPIETRTLSNGLPVTIMGVHKVPTVHLGLVVRGGVAADPPGKFGLANLTNAMLDEGAGSRSALEIADAIDFLGAELTTGGTADASFVDLHVPVARLAEALEVMSDVIARPTFPESELKRLREERLASLLEAQDDPEQLVAFAFPRLIFGAQHRYGTEPIGTAAALSSITPADLKAFHAAQYLPSNSALFVTGDVTAADVIPILEKGLGSWKGGAAPAQPPIPKAPQLTERHVYLIDKPGAAQSQIRMGWIGVPRSTADYFAIRVLNTILGGAFSSRLNNNLREVHGFAYGAGSNFDMRLGAGPFYAAAGVQTDKTAEALKEFFVELARIHDPIGADELQKAKNYLSLLMPRNFETTRAAANALAQTFVYNLPADYFQTYADHIRAVTADDVKRAADAYIQPDKFAVVIVGDRKAIESGVTALNLGPLTIVEAGDIFK
jgi:predicted Zn-dependent peptidase